MPAYLSLPTVETCLADPDFSCRLPDTFESDGDIAGLGVFIAFLIASILASIAGFCALWFEGLEYFRKAKRKYAQRKREFVDVFLISLGDTQIVTSIALLITTNYVVGCKISAYHYNLVCKLVLISSASHIGSIAFVHQYFGRSWVLGLVRSILLATSIGISGELFGRIQGSSIFPRAPPSGKIPDRNGTINTGLVLPASCFIEHPGVTGTNSYSNFTGSQYWNTNITTVPLPTNSSARFGSKNSSITASRNTSMPSFQTFGSNDVLANADFAFYVIIVVAFLFTIVASLVLSIFSDPDRLRKRHYCAYGLRCASYIAVNVAMIHGVWNFVALQDWMKESNWFGDDNGESSFRSFGQFMPLILLVLPVIAVLEEAYGHRKSSKGDNGDRKGSTGSDHPMANYPYDREE